MRLELQESGPSKFEWALAFVLFIIPFMSFLFRDTACFLMYELRFAQAILHGNLKEAYEPIVNIVAASGDNISSLSVYDLPLNLVFGIWGIPLYLYSARNGMLEITFTQSLWQMVYGKSLLLAAFIFSAVLVYKICRALELDERLSGWGAYIYFTSALATEAVGIFGQCDILSVSLSLLAILAFIRNQNKKFFFWFLWAVQFKQLAFFILVPLILIREKNLLRIILKFAALALFMFLCNLPVMRFTEAFSTRTSFVSGMLAELIGDNIPFAGYRASFMVFMFGALCIYCWLHESIDKLDKQEADRQIVFTVLTSAIVLFTSFPAHPHWFIHLAPYLAIAAIFNYHSIDKILLFETVGVAAVMVCRAWFSIVPDDAANMLLHTLLGRPDFMRRGVTTSIQDMISVSRAIKAAGTAGTSAAENNVVLMKLIQSAIESVYVVCMYTILWLCYPRKTQISCPPPLQ